MFQTCDQSQCNVSFNRAPHKLVWSDDRFEAKFMGVYDVKIFRNELKNCSLSLQELVTKFYRKDQELLSEVYLDCSSQDHLQVVEVVVDHLSILGTEYLTVQIFEHSKMF